MDPRALYEILNPPSDTDAWSEWDELTPPLEDEEFEDFEDPEEQDQVH